MMSTGGPVVNGGAVGAEWGARWAPGTGSAGPTDVALLAAALVFLVLVTVVAAAFAPDRPRSRS